MNLGFQYQIIYILKCILAYFHLERYDNTHFLYLILSFPFQIHIYKGRFVAAFALRQVCVVCYVVFSSQVCEESSRIRIATRIARNVLSA